VERPLRLRSAFPHRLRALRERIAGVRQRRPGRAEIAALDEECGRVEQTIGRLSLRAAGVRLALLEYQVHATVGDIERAENLEGLTALVRVKLGALRGHARDDLTRRMDEVAQAAPDEGAAWEPLLITDRLRRVQHVLERVETYERLEVDLRALRVRLEALETAAAGRRRRGEIVLLGRLTDRLEADGASLSETVRERLLQRIAAGLHRLEQRQP
jgi:hypothetical protein